MRRFFPYSLLILFVVICSYGQAQTYFWTETFGTGNCSQQNQLATAVSGPNGAWTLSSSGPHTAGANNWFISSTEAGFGPNGCGDGCLNTSTLTDRTLHIGSTPLAFWACLICPTGDCGAAYAEFNAASGICPGEVNPATNRRIESPTINCTGRTGITLSFNYIEGGEGLLDNATVEYFDGTTWSQISDPTKTLTNCALSQARWAKHSIALPASANGNANVKIGFRWVNNANGVGTDPSVAIDSVQLSVASGGPAPSAAWSSTDSTFCAGTCINFTDLSTNSPTGWTWYFPGGTPNTSSAQNPSNICYNTVGNYPVTLVVTNANGQDSVTMNNFITVQNCPPPVAAWSSTDSSFCAGTCINFTDLSTNSPNGWTWYFPGGTPNTSSAQNPSNICYNTVGNYPVTLVATNANGQDSVTITNFITVLNCPPPVADFSASDSTLCEGQCISFTDLSTNSPNGWTWYFPGATPTTSTAQNPTGICYASAGTYTVSLVASNANGQDSIAKVAFITVIPCGPPIAGITQSATEICEDNCVTYTDNSTDPASFSWTFQGGSPGVSNAQNPGQVCYATPGVFTVTLIVTNPNGSDTTTTTITVNASPVVNGGADQSILGGQTATLSANGVPGGGGYAWTPSMFVTCPTCATTDANPTDSTAFIVTYTDLNGCTDTDTVWVFVDNQYEWGIPNAFSPNGDNENDILFVRGFGFEALNLKVFNRYGQVVFETSDQAIGWDGKHKGVEVNPGVFVYYFSATFGNNATVEAKGNITLIR